MKYNKFNNIKQNRADTAYKHTELMKTLYDNDIQTSINQTHLFKNTSFTNGTINDKKISVDVIKMTTDAAIYKYGDDCCALNFASYKYPGGGFIKGAMAQEEALCHVSTLFNVISSSKFEKEYEYNRHHLNNSLYSNWALYSPNIVFINDNEYETWCNIITCPSPNLKSYIENYNGQFDNNYKNILKSRLKYILDIAQYMHEHTLILGAFGCGVFGNDPNVVASLFKELLNSGYYTFTKVIFAIPDDKNYIPFKNIFNN